MKKKLYSVRSVFRYKDLSDKKKFVYEERITIWEAESNKSAFKKSEEEAKAYAKENKCDHLDFGQSFYLYVTEMTSGTEVFSLMRESNKKKNDYLDSFFDTGNECQKFA